MSAKWAAALLCMIAAAAGEQGRIVRPVDRSSFREGPVEVIATAPGGTLELDGARIPASQPFPNVLQAQVEVKPGIHTLALVWEGGRSEIRFHAGPAPPEGFEPFRPHPPSATACTQCHALSRRGRFVFRGGCFDCHNSGGFVKTHTHTAEVLSECGLCHNAHGSTAKRHLIMTKEAACRQCHG